MAFNFISSVLPRVRFFIGLFTLCFAAAWWPLTGWAHPNGLRGDSIKRSFVVPPASVPSLPPNSSSATKSFAGLSWTKVAPGVWRAVVGVPEAIDFLKAAQAKPKLDRLALLPEQGFPLNKEDIHAEQSTQQTVLRFPLQEGEQLYGFGLQFQTVHQRGKILELHVDHYGGRDNGRTHAPTPFYVSSLGYGVFVNVARYLKVYAGATVRKDAKHPPVARDRNLDKKWTNKPYSDAVEMMVPAAGAEVFVFEGPSPLEAVRRFNLFCGGGALPPRWGLGFTQRVQRLFDATMAEKEVDEFQKRGFPLDFLGLEPGWQSKSYPCTFVWDSTRFPQPKEFVNRLLQKGVRVNLWSNPYVSPESPLFKPIEPFTASHTVWVGLVPDFLNKKATDLFFNHLSKDQVSIGVSGYKFDEVDGGDQYLWPDWARFPSGFNGEQMRQIYGVLVQRHSTDMFKKMNLRTWGLVRGSNAGAVSFPYVIYNDYYNHRDFITALINSGFSGVLWTPEVRASKTPEEWLRRFQSTIFSPMAMINAWSSGTKPWSFPEVADQVRACALLRMQMMPYWYNAFADYYFNGTPPFRAMNLETGFTGSIEKKQSNASLEENPYEEAVVAEIKDQYMAGPSLLVAPMFAGDSVRTVVLPKGNWYDFYTGDFAGNGQVLTVKPGLDKIPVYVKEGAVIPFMEPRLHAPSSKEKINIELRVYGNKPTTFELYDDDGESYDMERGAFQWRKVSISFDKNGQLIGTVSPPENGKPSTYNQISFKRMTVPAVVQESPKVFQASWKSLAEGYQVPEWFRDAKFGIFMHWGIQSALDENRDYGGSHYGRYMYGEGEYPPGHERSVQAEKLLKWHTKRYGHPNKVGYKDLIPYFKAEKWDPDALVAFYKECGVQYIVPVAVHHDNFDLFPSTLHRWNSVNMGPKKDIINGWRDAALKHGLRFGVSSHIDRVPSFFQTSRKFDGKNPETADFYASNYLIDYQRDTAWNRLIFLRTMDLIDRYQPDLLYFDGSLPGNSNGMTYGLELAAHFYNANQKWNNGKLEAVMNLKHGPDKRAFVWDIERGQSDALQKNAWQTDTDLQGGWYYRKTGVQFTPELAIANLVDIVSKNGNLLLNVGLKGDGTLPDNQIQVLRAMGLWLKTNGEAIYGSRPWVVYGEGPTKVETGAFKEQKDPYTSQDIRFTTHNGYLYAFLLGKSTDNKITIRSLSQMLTLVSNIEEVTLLGHNGKISWERNKDGLIVSLPPEANGFTVPVLKIKTDDKSAQQWELIIE